MTVCILFRFLFSEDLSRKVYISGTVVYMCIQLAVYLGFAEIYLLGTDFTGVNNYGSKYGHFYDEKDLDLHNVSARN